MISLELSLYLVTQYKKGRKTLHRVVNLVSVGIDPETIAGYKEEIRTKLSEYDVYVGEVNDGVSEGGEPTLAINADFNSATKANEFHNWLKDFLTAHKEDFKNARTRVHDCFHASNQNMPCQLGDVWELI